MMEALVVRCDLCGVVVKGDNTDSWAGLLPLKSTPLTDDEKSAGLVRSKYSISNVDVCLSCKDKLGDWIYLQKK